MMDRRNALLDALLKHAPFDGWTQHALEKAAKDCGLSPFDAKRAFPQGIADALAYFATRTDEHMLAELARDYSLTTMKIRERIATAVMVRLRLLMPHREAVRRAVAFYAMPWNAPLGMKAVWATADAMWRAAGDTATDWNHYSKRVLLSKVYTTTLHAWLSDESEGLAETEAFLRRRIENVMQIEKLKAKAKEGLSKLQSFVPDLAKRF